MKREEQLPFLTENLLRSRRRKSFGWVYRNMYLTALDYRCDPTHNSKKWFATTEQIPSALRWAQRLLMRGKS
jgi:hypothetical protein